MFDALSIKFTSACWIALPSTSATTPSAGTCRRNGDAFFCGIWFHQFGRLPRQRDEVRRLELELLAPLLDARKVQNIFDEGRKPAALLDNESKIFVLLLWFDNFAALQSFGHQTHGCDGRAQFMRHAGNELLFISLNVAVFETPATPRQIQMSAAAADTPINMPNQTVRARWVAYKYSESMR